jgi:hypothetical protein
MKETEGLADFILLHMKEHLKDPVFTKELTGYRGSVSAYRHLNQAQEGLRQALTQNMSLTVVWEEAAKFALWLARVADLYEKEKDREDEASAA